MGIAKKMFSGNIGSIENRKMSKATKVFFDKLANQDELLTKMLTAEQCEEFCKFKEIIAEMHYNEETEVYEYAFNIGLALGYECKTNIGEMIK